MLHPTVVRSQDSYRQSRETHPMSVRRRSVPVSLSLESVRGLYLPVQSGPGTRRGLGSESGYLIYSGIVLVSRENNKEVWTFVNLVCLSATDALLAYRGIF